MSEPYVATFPRGAHVAVAPRDVLEQFRQQWHLHDPLVLEQLPFAGTVQQVDDVGFYHGGTVLYRLAGVPGIWHEGCLRPAP